MSRTRQSLAFLGALALSTAISGVGLAAPSSSPSSSAPGTQKPQTSSPAQPGKPQAHRARAWLRLDVAQTKPWVGQPVPITVTAYFRDVEGVTLEGAPQLTSKAIITSDLARDPRQSAEVVDGERALVARWTGTVTPSTAGPLDLSVELPVRIRYREAPPRSAQQPQAPDPFDEDPFADLGAGGSIDAIFARMQQRMMQQLHQVEGPVREQALPLVASVRALDVRALPTEHRPATFSGAVGRFDLDASVSSTTAHVSDPLTVRTVVSGSGDLDRVDLPGIQSSDAWKAYPPHVVTEKAPAKGPPRKVFEQVVVPLHGGELTVPPVSLTAFDPAAGTYVTRSTQPLVISVEGAAAPASLPAPAPSAASAAPPAPSHDDAAAGAAHAAVAPINGPITFVSPLHVALRVVPVLALVALAALVKLLRRGRVEHSLRRAMRRAASAGNVGSFLGSAHELIARRLSQRWGVAPDDVTAHAVRERLGPRGQPLAEVLDARERLRFARGDLETAEPRTRRTELGAMCSSIEQSLRGAT